MAENKEVEKRGFLWRVRRKVRGVRSSAGAQEKGSARSSADEEKEKNNLTLLGVLAVGIAVLTTGISVLIYHKSGDIYLDRSRPGFLPDEEEIKSEPERENYEFSDSGEINKEVLDEYLEHYMDELNKLDEYTEPFSDKPLSDGSLGI